MPFVDWLVQFGFLLGATALQLLALCCCSCVRVFPGQKNTSARAKVGPRNSYDESPLDLDPPEPIFLTDYCSPCQSWLEGGEGAVFLQEIMVWVLIIMCVCVVSTSSSRLFFCDHAIPLSTF